ncbi:hypothetical protein [Cellulosimicrobium cellulans]|uniref:hypothetical protein n=1 Tax=Cellulosimicrobium cellulans TaxID=1710 RepID=UPI00130D7742|nr:hypothetical protein [Cellulosimicrobium cellulans]
MTPVTIEVTRDDLLARRAKILRRLGTTIEALRSRASSGTPSAEEWDAIAELEEISFLLDDSADDF